MSKASRKFQVPDQLANLYDFANTLDLRHFTHLGVQHPTGDELTSPRELDAWLSARRLLQSGARTSPAMLRLALALRAAIRAYLECDPAGRRSSKNILRSLNEAARQFPLTAAADDDGRMQLQPARDDALNGLSSIVAEFYNGAASGALDRLKTCASDECLRVFFDRSKPGSRRWCVSTLCGNRVKTRNYRERLRES